MARGVFALSLLVLAACVPLVAGQTMFCYQDFITSFYGSPGLSDNNLDGTLVNNLVQATKDCDVSIYSGFTEGNRNAGECGPACTAIFNGLNSGEHGVYKKYVSKSVGNSGRGGTRRLARDTMDGGFADPTELSNAVSRTYFHQQYAVFVKDDVITVNSEETIGSEDIMVDPFWIKGTYNKALTGGDRADVQPETPTTAFFKAVGRTLGLVRQESLEAGQPCCVGALAVDLHGGSLNREFTAAAPIYAAQKCAVTVLALTTSNGDKGDNRAEVGNTPLGQAPDAFFKPALDRSPPLATGLNGLPTEHFLVSGAVDVEVLPKDVGVHQVQGLEANNNIRAAVSGMRSTVEGRQGFLGPRPPPPQEKAAHYPLYMILPLVAPPVAGSILLALLAGAGVLGIMGGAAYYNRGAIAAALGGAKSEKSGWAESSGGSVSNGRWADMDKQSGASGFTRGGDADGMSGNSGFTRGGADGDGMSGHSGMERDGKHMSGITGYTRSSGSGKSRSSKGSKGSKGSHGGRKHSAGRKNSGNRMTGITGFTRSGSVGSKSHASRGSRSSSGGSSGGHSHATKASRSSSTGSSGGHSHATKASRSSSTGSRGSKGSKGGHSHASKASRSSSGSGGRKHSHGRRH